MIISDIRTRQFEGVTELAARIVSDTAPGQSFDAWFRFSIPLPELQIVGDPFLAAFLLGCMYDGEDLHVNSPVSAKMLEAMDEQQSTFASWYPDCMKKIAITSTETHGQLRSSRTSRTGCFFSGGVDSWYSFLKNQDEVTDLIIINGFDIRAGNDTVWDRTRNAVETAAVEYDKQMIAVNSNIYTLTEKACPVWGRRFSGNFYASVSHGSALASVALGLQSVLDKVLIPSSFITAELRPWGSNPHIDILWASEDLTIIHDGCESTRLEKTRRVAASDLALCTLRVCSNNGRGDYNCCTCEKCVRTMLTLRLFGTLHRSKSFDRPLNLRYVMCMNQPSSESLSLHRDILEAARTSGDIEVMYAEQVMLGDKRSVYRVMRRAGRSVYRFCRRMIHKRIRIAVGGMAVRVWEALNKRQD
ncbi:MAG: hypothetical protein ABFD54_10150 [Armatimonadota bacterium]|nr:hypothetical protein [bacterium]